MNRMPFASQNTEAITFLANDTTLAFFGAEKVKCSTAFIAFWSLVQSDGLNIPLGRENAQQNDLGLPQLLPSLLLT